MKEKITCRYIGHATTLISFDGVNILTDPHFSRRTLFFKRVKELGFDPTDLPVIACVLISHTHFDHLNISSFKYIPQNVPVIVPEGCDSSISKFVSNPVIELSQFATHELPGGTKITAVPVKHRGGRFSYLRFTKSSGYLIQRGERTVFFAGDASYSEHFAEVGSTAQIDLALLPIAGYSPRFFMRNRHMTPSEVVQAFEDLKAARMIPIHWGSFTLSLEPIGQPMELLSRILEERPDLKERILIVPHGERITIE